MPTLVVVGQMHWSRYVSNMTFSRGSVVGQAYLSVVPIFRKVTVWDFLAVIVGLLVEPRAGGIGQSGIPTRHVQVLSLAIDSRVLELLVIGEVLGIFLGVTG